jgi:acyl-CoA reductase-like NAD-dependent aldehyde dehydrogenase
LFLFNGYGPNPFVIGADADIEHAAAKAIEARTFNSGQDCAGPDVFFVAHESYNEFLEKLCLSCESIPVGDYSDSSSVAVGPLIDQVTYNSIAKLLADSEYEVLSGGRCDSRKRMVYPTVVRPSGDNNYQPPPEWFSPVFNIVPYACKDELESFFLSDYYREHAMYLSSFGSMPISSHSLGKTQILKCKTVIYYPCTLRT